MIKARVTSILYKTGSFVYDIFAFTYKLPERIRYKLYRRSCLQSYQLNYNSYIAQAELIEFKPELDDNGILPGRIFQNEELSALEANDGIHEMVANAFDHKNKLVSDVFFDTSHRDDNSSPVFDAFLKTINISSDLKYQKINWHKDFRSGYEWDANKFYTNIKVSEGVHADIKIPRELSRFNHIGLLVLGERVIGKSGADEFALQVTDWISQNQFGYGLNWACAMDVALRAINWIWGISLFRNEVKRQPEFVKLIKRSLYAHAIHIENNLEYSPLTTGNHYLSNIVGLLYISAFLAEVEDSDRWLIFSLQEILSEMEREVYEDGMAHEGSTHYHRLVTELFISAALIIERLPVERLYKLYDAKFPKGRMPAVRKDILKRINLTGNRNKLPDEFYIKLFKMASFTAAITKQNNNVPQIGDNDSARVHKIVYTFPENFSDHRHILATITRMLGIKFEGIEMSVEAQMESKILTDGIHFIPIKNISVKTEDIKYFKNAGIVSVKKGVMNLIVTCGQNGQSKRGGHNHNDKLSFELNLFGHDVFVDSGCPVYTAHPELRNFFRSTSSHNTILVDNQEQERWNSGIEGLFSLRQRSNPALLVKGNDIHGTHYGYEVPHNRTFSIKETEIHIVDLIESNKPKVFNITLYPDVIVDKSVIEGDKLTINLILPNKKKVFLYINSVKSYRFSKVKFGYSYGVFGETNRLSIDMINHNLSTIIKWENEAGN